jgi:hypothetical protein
MNIRSHLTGMLLAGAAALAVALLAGFSLSSALPYAALLACPLMMVGMMVMMSRGGGHAGGKGGCGHDHSAHGDSTAAGVSRGTDEPRDDHRVPAPRG